MKAHLGTSRRTLRGAFCVLMISAAGLLLYCINAAVLRWQCCTLLVLLVLLVSVAVTVYAAPQRLVKPLGTG